MGSGFYDSGLVDIGKGSIDLGVKTLKVMLVNSTYSNTGFSTAHDFVIDITTSTVDDEIGSTNYTGGYGGAGRKALSADSWAASSGYIVYDDTANITWTSLGATSGGSTVGGCVLICEDMTTATDDTTTPLVCLIDFGDKVTDGSDFVIQWNASGIFRIDNTGAGS